MSDNHIPGISDYCDHWCEHCAFTAQCKDYPATLDPQSENHVHPQLLDRIRVNFEKAMVKIQGSTDRDSRGVYSLLALEKHKKKLLANNPILELSQRYAEMSGSWLKTQPGMLDRLEQLKEELTMGVESASAGMSMAETIRNSLAVIHWDASLIHSKLVEALSLRIKEQSDIKIPNDIHSDGVAKVALLSIDRSLNAWRAMFDMLTDREDDFLHVMALLQKLEREIAAVFPYARDFKRPGFDDPAFETPSSATHS